jgi:hypothetical protein
MGYPGIRAWLPYLIMLPLAIAMLLALGRVKIRVTPETETGSDESELWIGDAHLPLRYIGKIEVIDRDRKRKALGPELDPAAFVSHRGWIGPVVRIEVTDPRDRTPYWLFSTRKPEQLAQLLAAHQMLSNS